MSCDRPISAVPSLRAPSLSAPSLRNVPRRVDRNIRATHYQAVEAVARVQGGALVTHTAMIYSASLSAEEDRLIRETGNRALEFRLAAIGDSFAALGCAEIARMGWRR